MRSWNRLGVFGLLYFSEGAPIGLIWWALPTRMRAEGLPVERITVLMSLLVLPWVFKFLWAPAVDWGGRDLRRLAGWVVGAQWVMGWSLVPLIWLSPATGFAWWSGLLLLHALAAATQDVAIDALAVRSTPPAELGRVNGAMQAGMLLGRSLFGGGALLAAAHVGWAWVTAGLVACIWSFMAVPWRLRQNESWSEPSTNPRDRPAIGTALAGAWRRREPWLGLGFALVAGAAFESVGGLAGPYLVDQGVPENQIGWFFGIVSVGAMLAGGLAGGVLADRFGRRRTVAVFLTSLALTTLVLAAMDGRPGAEASAQRFVVLGFLYLGIGMFVAASYGLFMDLTDRRVGGTQFSAFMAATNGCEAWSAAAAGRLTGIVGYGGAFAIMALVSLTGLAFLPWMRLRAAVSARSRRIGR